MIKTQLTREDALQILELGRQLHAESRFNEQPYDEQRCWTVLDATVRFPEKFFIAYDDSFKGFIIMHMQEHYWSGHKWATDFCLYVAPEKRGSMMAYRLEKAAEKWAKEKGAREMTIFHNTGINMEDAPAIFNRLGFNTAGYIFTKELK